MDPLHLLETCPMPLFSTDTPVDELLDRSILPPMDVAENGTPAHFPVSIEMPLEDLHELQHRPIPRASVLDRTLDLLRSGPEVTGRAILDVRYDPPIPTPVWMLRYWLRLSSASHARRAWSNTRDFLLQRRAALALTPGQALDDVCLALSSLSALPWHYQVCDTPPIHTRDLLDILSPVPLAVSAVRMVVEVLRYEIRTNHPTLASHISIHGLALQDRLLVVQPFLHQADHPQVVIAHLLADPLIGNPPRVHRAFLPWLSRGTYRLYVLETRPRIIRHGSMDGQPPPEGDIDLLRSWLEFASNAPWSVGDSITVGCPEDGYSCGIAVINAIRYDVLGDTLWRPSTREACRLREYARIIEYMAARDRL